MLVRKKKRKGGGAEKGSSTPRFRESYLAKNERATGRVKVIVNLNGSLRLQRMRHKRGARLDKESPLHPVGREWDPSREQKIQGTVMKARGRGARHPHVGTGFS